MARTSAWALVWVEQLNAADNQWERVGASRLTRYTYRVSYPSDWDSFVEHLTADDIGPFRTRAVRIWSGITTCIYILGGLLVLFGGSLMPFGGFLILYGGSLLSVGGSLIIFGDSFWTPFYLWWLADVLCTFSRFSQ